uniref:Uncharacterized protein n=1 Tax=Chara braunii TaxID=69332 RepID=A0A388KST1_CHABU
MSKDGTLNRTGDNSARVTPRSSSRPQRDKKEKRKKKLPESGPTAEGVPSMPERHAQEPESMPRQASGVLAGSTAAHESTSTVDMRSGEEHAKAEGAKPTAAAPRPEDILSVPQDAARVQAAQGQTQVHAEGQAQAQVQGQAQAQVQPLATALASKDGRVRRTISAPFGRVLNANIAAALAEGDGDGEDSIFAENSGEICEEKPSYILTYNDLCCEASQMGSALPELLSGDEKAVAEDTQKRTHEVGKNVVTSISDSSRGVLEQPSATVDTLAKTDIDQGGLRRGRGMNRANIGQGAVESRAAGSLAVAIEFLGDDRGLFDESDEDRRSWDANRFHDQATERESVSSLSTSVSSAPQQQRTRRVVISRGGLFSDDEHVEGDFAVRDSGKPPVHQEGRARFENRSGSHERSVSGEDSRDLWDTGHRALGMGINHWNDVKVAAASSRTIMDKGLFDDDGSDADGNEEGRYVRKTGQTALSGWQSELDGISGQLAEHSAWRGTAVDVSEPVGRKDPLCSTSSSSHSLVDASLINVESFSDVNASSRHRSQHQGSFQMGGNIQNVFPEGQTRQSPFGQDNEGLDLFQQHQLEEPSVPDDEVAGVLRVSYQERGKGGRQSDKLSQSGRLLCTNGPFHQQTPGNAGKEDGNEQESGSIREGEIDVSLSDDSQEGEDDTVVLSVRKLSTAIQEVEDASKNAPRVRVVAGISEQGVRECALADSDTTDTALDMRNVGNFRAGESNSSLSAPRGTATNVKFGESGLAEVGEMQLWPELAMAGGVESRSPDSSHAAEVLLGSEKAPCAELAMETEGVGKGPSLADGASQGEGESGAKDMLPSSADDEGFSGLSGGTGMIVSGTEKETGARIDNACEGGGEEPIGVENACKPISQMPGVSTEDAAMGLYPHHPGEEEGKHFERGRLLSDHNRAPILLPRQRSDMEDGAALPHLCETAADHTCRRQEKPSYILTYNDLCCEASQMGSALPELLSGDERAVAEDTQKRTYEVGKESKEAVTSISDSSRGVLEQPSATVDTLAKTDSDRGGLRRGRGMSRANTGQGGVESRAAGSLAVAIEFLGDDRGLFDGSDEDRTSWDANRFHDQATERESVSSLNTSVSSAPQQQRTRRVVISRGGLFGDDEHVEGDFAVRDSGKLPVHQEGGAGFENRSGSHEKSVSGEDSRDLWDTGHRALGMGINHWNDAKVAAASSRTMTDKGLFDADGSDADGNEEGRYARKTGQAALSGWQSEMDGISGQLAEHSAWRGTAVDVSEPVGRKDPLCSTSSSSHSLVDASLINVESFSDVNASSRHRSQHQGSFQMGGNIQDVFPEGQTRQSPFGQDNEGLDLFQQHQLEEPSFPDDEVAGVSERSCSNTSARTPVLASTLAVAALSSTFIASLTANHASPAHLRTVVSLIGRLEYWLAENCRLRPDASFMDCFTDVEAREVLLEVTEEALEPIASFIHDHDRSQLADGVWRCWLLLAQLRQLLREKYVLLDSMAELELRGDSNILQVSKEGKEGGEVTKLSRCGLLLCTNGPVHWQSQGNAGKEDGNEQENGRIREDENDVSVSDDSQEGEEDDTVVLSVRKLSTAIQDASKNAPRVRVVAGISQQARVCIGRLRNYGCGT